MLARVLNRAIDAQERWAKPLGDRVHGVVAAIFGRILPLRDLLNGTWLGHPLHSLLTDIPIGALTLVIVFDLLGQRVAADVALVLGVLAMLAAAAAGFADYSVTDGKARVRATVHSALMVLALAPRGLRARGGSRRWLPAEFDDRHGLARAPAMTRTVVIIRVATADTRAGGSTLPPTGERSRITGVDTRPLVRRASLPDLPPGVSFGPNRTILEGLGWGAGLAGPSSRR